MIKIILFLSLFIINSHGSIYCSKYFDSSTFSDVLNDLSRVQSISRLEKLASGIRKLKANPKIIERDRFYIESLLRDDDLLYSGSTDLLQQKWASLFRETELSYHRLTFHEKLLKSISFDGKSSFIEVLDEASYYFKGSFEKSLIVSYQESYESIDTFLVFLKKYIRKDAQVLGNKFHRYRLTRRHIEYAMQSSSCTTYCKGKAQQLLNSLGVSSKIEHLMFPSFSNLKRPNLYSMSSKALSHPIANELMSYQNILLELKAVIRDQVIAPRARRAFVSFLRKKFPRRSETVIIIERLLLNTEARINHFPLIDMSIRKGDITSRFNILRSYNATYGNDALLTTFARRVDQKARNAWRELLDYSKKNETDFAQRMLAANKNADLLGELSQSYKVSSARTFVSIAFGFGIFKSLEIVYEKTKDALYNQEEDSPIQLEEKDIKKLQELMKLLSEGIIEFNH